MPPKRAAIERKLGVQLGEGKTVERGRGKNERIAYITRLAEKQQVSQGAKAGKKFEKSLRGKAGKVASKVQAPTNKLLQMIFK